MASPLVGVKVKVAWPLLTLTAGLLVVTFPLGSVTVKVTVPAEMLAGVPPPHPPLVTVAVKVIDVGGLLLLSTTGFAEPVTVVRVGAAATFSVTEEEVLALPMPSVLAGV